MQPRKYLTNFRFTSTTEYSLFQAIAIAFFEPGFHLSATVGDSLSVVVQGERPQRIFTVELPQTIGYHRTVCVNQALKPGCRKNPR